MACHPSHINKKLSDASQIFSKVRHFVPKTTLIKLYYSFVYTHLKYGIVSWGDTNFTSIYQLQIILFILWKMTKKYNSKNKTKI